MKHVLTTLRAQLADLRMRRRLLESTAASDEISVINEAICELSDAIELFTLCSESNSLLHAIASEVDLVCTCKFKYQKNLDRKSLFHIQ